MSRPLRLEFPGALWHVTARGNERKAIYRDDDDRRAWLELLGAAIGDWGWVLHAYVLMPNHYHLLVETPEMTLSEGMRQLNGVYTQEFNRKYRRAGHLFQGRFKGILVSEDDHLVEMLRYIVLNPVRAKLCQHPGQWAWSNYRATAGKSRQPKWLDVRRTLAIFSNTNRALARRRYAEFVHSARDVEYRPWEILRGQIFLGDEGFAREMQARIDAKPDAPEIPRAQRTPARPVLGRNVTQARALTGATEESLRRQQRSDARLLICRLGRRFHHSHREIGAVLGIGRSAAGRLDDEAKRREASDPAFARLLKRGMSALQSKA